jgi:2,4-dienoyl-CoA reductase-like NADH-dependent reductase (Old Yellow Enzyme family)
VIADDLDLAADAAERLSGLVDQLDTGQNIAEGGLEAEEFDLIAVGRAILSDPRWVTKIKTGDSEALQPFDPASMAELV